MSNEKMSFKESWQVTKRGYQMWWKECPRIFLAIITNGFVAGITPYVAIFLTAQILAEIIGLQRAEVLRNLVIWALASALVLGFLVAVTKRWKNAEFEKVYPLQAKFFADKSMDMDFITVDDSRIKDLRTQVRQNAHWRGMGMPILVYSFDQLFRGAVAIIGSLILTWNFFTTTIPMGAGWIEILNNPLIRILLITLLIFLSAIGPSFNGKAYARQSLFGEDMTFYNRFFSFVMNMKTAENQMDIRMYSQEKTIFGLEKSLGKFRDFRMCRDYKTGLGALYLALGTVMSQLFIGIIYVLVALKASVGAFGVAAAAQYLGTLTILSQQLTIFLEGIGQLSSNASFLKSVFELFDEPNPMYQGSLSVEKRTDNKYEIEFRNVSFKYPQVDTYALKNVTLKFEYGERLAIVGENGSGKTTFIKLLCRLYDPTEGEILLNGIDIRKYDYYEYMDIFSVVFQDFRLFSFGLGENVAVASKYDADRVVECLEGAGFGERLATLENGLSTNLTKQFADDGIDISGGEKQKIALARALYKDAAYIILDEPTAALDPIAEHEVYSRMNEITQGKTAIFISHRLSSCRFCQDIIVFHDGELIQQGSHDELVENIDGKYHELWYAQAQYYVENESSS